MTEVNKIPIVNEDTQKALLKTQAHVVNRYNYNNGSNRKDQGVLYRYYIEPTYFFVNFMLRKGRIPPVPKYDGKTKVTIDGFAISRNKRITICAQCAKSSGCSHNQYLCTSAGYWSDTKNKYKWKIMGRYRLTRWVRKQDAKLKENWS